MSAPVTMRHVAEKAGVSRATVSFVLNGRERADGSISEQTRQRVLEVASALGYDPALHLSARRLAAQSGPSRLVNGVVTLFFPPDFLDVPYFARVFRGLMEAASADGFEVNTVYFSDSPKFRIPASIARGDVDGVLLFAYHAEASRLLERLRQEPRFGARPAISLLHPLAGCSAVYADERAGAYAALSHLLQLGHRRMLHFCGSGACDYHSLRRLEGFESACRDYGVRPADCLVGTSLETGTPRPRLQRLRDALEPALRGERPVTAVLAQNDSHVRDLQFILGEHGLSVPGDISLVGFDDAEPLPDAQGCNILTTVKMPLEAIGQEAGRWLVQSVQDNKKMAGDLVLPTSLQVRGSTAPPPGGSQ